MSADLDIVASFSLRLGGGSISLERLRALVVSLPGTEVSTELGVSIEYGPTSDWRSLDRVMHQSLKGLLREKDAIGYSEVEASLFTASTINTSWTLSPEIISLLALLHTGISVRILDTSHPSERPNKTPQTIRTFGPRG